MPLLKTMISNKSIPLVIDDSYYEAGIIRWITIDNIFKEGQRFLICGPSGSGKTVLATTLVGKIGLYLPDSIIFVIDPKGIDFRFCEGCLNYYAVDKAQEGLERFFALFEKRLYDYTTCSQPAILFVDELSSLILSLPKKEAEVLRNKMARILNLSRALNISVITALQRADASLFENGARDNYNIRFLMGNIANNKESVSMIASEYKEYIKPCSTGFGYMIADDGIKKIRSVMPKNTGKLHKVICEAVNRRPLGGAEQ